MLPLPILLGAQRVHGLYGGYRGYGSALKLKNTILEYSELKDPNLKGAELKDPNLKGAELKNPSLYSDIEFKNPSLSEGD